MNTPTRPPWWVSLIAETPDEAKARTAIADAMFAAVERAVFDPKHELHRQTFGFYRPEREQKETRRR